MPGDRRLDEMPEGVQLVAPGQVRVLASGRDDLDIRVQVTVLALGTLDQADDLVRGSGQDPVPFPPELPADGLEPLVHVGVEEREDDPGRLAERAIPAMGAGRQRQVRQVPGEAQLLEPVRDRALPVRAQALRPEAASHPDLLRSERRQPGDRPRRRSDGRRRRRTRRETPRGHFSAPLVNPDT